MAIYTDCTFTPPSIATITPVSPTAGASISHRGTVPMSSSGSYCGECDATNSHGATVAGIYVITGGTSTCEPCVGTDGVDGGGGAPSQGEAHVRCGCTVKGTVQVDPLDMYGMAAADKADAAIATTLQVVGTKSISYQVGATEWADAQALGITTGTFDSETGLGWVTQSVSVTATSPFSDAVSPGGDTFTATVKMECCDSYYGKISTPDSFNEAGDSTGNTPPKIGILTITDFQCKADHDFLSDGTSWEIAPTGPVYHPFQILTKLEGSTWKAGVAAGTLLLSPAWNNKQAITNLLSADKTTGWFNVSSADSIWLEIAWSGATISSCAIKSFGHGDTWSDLSQTVAFASSSSPAQTIARFPIGYITSASSGKPIITQSLKTSLQLTRAVHQGKACLYPRPHITAFA